MKSRSISNFLVHLGYLRRIAISYYEGTLLIYERGKPQKLLHSFCLLTSTSLELFLKVIIAADICKREKNNEHTERSIREKVDNHLRGRGHNLKKLIEDAGIKSECNIKKVQITDNEVVNEYRIIFENDEVCCFKDSESVRYGSLASKKDIAVWVGANYNKRFINFLNKLKILSEERLQAVIDIL